tara:strand:+ start:1216 stop:1665 length:450 start_codon:yes stop_codon:yes gene_type:complete
MKKTFNAKNIGCFIDGDYTLGHAMLRMHALMHACSILPSTEGIKELDTILISGNPEKLSEISYKPSEFDQVQKFLQDNTEDGLIWVWSTGSRGVNFILTNEQMWNARLWGKTENDIPGCKTIDMVSPHGHPYLSTASWVDAYLETEKTK